MSISEPGDGQSATITIDDRGIIVTFCRRFGNHTTVTIRDSDTPTQCVTVSQVEVDFLVKLFRKLVEVKSST